MLIIEIDDKKLDKVSGGKIVESKEGKYILLPPNVKEFDTKEYARKEEELLFNGGVRLFSGINKYNL